MKGEGDEMRGQGESLGLGIDRPNAPGWARWAMGIELVIPDGARAARARQI
jgi:hypothetical protein